VIRGASRAPGQLFRPVLARRKQTDAEKASDVLRAIGQGIGIAGSAWNLGSSIYRSGLDTDEENLAQMRSAFARDQMAMAEPQAPILSGIQAPKASGGKSVAQVGAAEGRDALRAAIEQVAMGAPRGHGRARVGQIPIEDLREPGPAPSLSWPEWSRALGREQPAPASGPFAEPKRLERKGAPAGAGDTFTLTVPKGVNGVKAARWLRKEGGFVNRRAMIKATVGGWDFSREKPLRAGAKVTFKRPAGATAPREVAAAAMEEARAGGATGEEARVIGAEKALDGPALPPGWNQKDYDDASLLEKSFILVTTKRIKAQYGGAPAAEARTAADFEAAHQRGEDFLLADLGESWAALKAAGRSPEARELRRVAVKAVDAGSHIGSAAEMGDWESGRPVPPVLRARLYAEISRLGKASAPKPSTGWTADEVRELSKIRGKKRSRRRRGTGGPTPSSQKRDVKVGRHMMTEDEANDSAFVIVATYYGIERARMFDQGVAGSSRLTKEVAKIAEKSPDDPRLVTVDKVWSERFGGVDEHTPSARVSEMRGAWRTDAMELAESQKTEADTEKARVKAIATALNISNADASSEESTVRDGAISLLKKMAGGGIAVTFASGDNPSVIRIGKTNYSLGYGGFGMKGVPIVSPAAQKALTNPGWRKKNKVKMAGAKTQAISAAKAKLATWAKARLLAYANTAP